MEQGKLEISELAEPKLITNDTEEKCVEMFPKPNEDEARELRRVIGGLHWYTYLICLVEFAERASFIGTSTRLYNFIQQPLPPNSPHGTGAVAPGDKKSPSGALGRGLRVASALTLLLTFFSYVTPLVGGYVADKSWGRFKTLWVGVWVGFLSHIIFIIAAIPSVIENGQAALAPIILGILTLSWGSGFIKPNLVPLLFDQFPHQTDVITTLPSGERVIIDRDASLQRITMIVYWSVSSGSFLSIATSYAARNVGFWLAFLVPTIVYMLMIPLLWIMDKHIEKHEPSGRSAMVDSFKVLKVCFESGWISRARAGRFWQYAMPSNRANASCCNTACDCGYDDQFVLDVKASLECCKIFFFYIIFCVNDNGLSALQTSQAASMLSKGVPNDLMNSFRPLAIVIFTPILDLGFYPLMRKLKINIWPAYKCTIGFLFASFASMVGAILQYRIYALSPCGNHATTCREPANISIWYEVIIYVLIALGELFSVVTGYQIAYNKSPEHMKGFTMALLLFTMSLAAVVSQAATGAMVDPRLPSIYLVIFIIGVVFALAFLVIFRNLHKEMAQEQCANEQCANEQLKEQKLSKNDSLVDSTSDIHSV